MRLFVTYLILPAVLLRAADGRLASASEEKTAEFRSFPEHGDKALKKALHNIPPPVAVEARNPEDEMLHRLREMVIAYGLPMGYGPITIEIDYLGNPVYDKLPNDIAQIARDIFAKAGISTFRTLPEAAASKGSSAIALPQLLRDRGTPPKPPTFRLVGGIEGTEQLVVKGRNGRIDVEGGGGKTFTNGGLTGDHGSILTVGTIGLTLEHPNSLDVEGASARVSFYVEQTDSNHGVELYMGGNGLGIGRRLKTSQDPLRAAYSAMAMNIATVLGSALKIPYFRCDENFSHDTALEYRVRQDFERLTDAQLTAKLQRFLIVAGFGIGRQWPLQPTDRAVLIVEMQHRKLPVDHAGMVELAMQFWRGVGLNYRDGAKRMAKIYVDNDRSAAEQAEQEAVQQAALRVDPREFGFAPGTRIIVVDLSPIRRPDVLKYISATFRHCRNCGEVRWHQQRPLVALNTAMKESEVQSLITSTRLPFEYVWSHVQSPRLLVVPVGMTDSASIR